MNNLCPSCGTSPGHYIKQHLIVFMLQCGCKPFQPLSQDISTHPCLGFLEALVLLKNTFYIWLNVLLAVTNPWTSQSLCLSVSHNQSSGWMTPRPASSSAAGTRSTELLLWVTLTEISRSRLEQTPVSSINTPDKINYTEAIPSSYFLYKLAEKVGGVLWFY